MACLTPFIVKKKTSPESIPVPCGRCPHCLKRRASGWSFRLMQEERRSSSAQFITLTYDTKTVPITRNGFMCLAKKDVQDFFKRLRKAHGSTHATIKYFCVGEYGTRTKRPHYHIICFNARLDLIENAWGKGLVHFGQVSGASIGYTLKYMMKPSKIPVHINDDRVPEFCLMSKGLGMSYLTEKMISWHKADLDDRMYCNLLDGKKIAMPRYYKDKIYSETERKRVAFMSRLKMLQVELSDGRTEHEKVEAHKAAFDRMHKSSILKRDKV